ncbi:sulfotransferase [Motilimonas cestriensis]|uniref:Sulfotransferase n=1 Tax=Motilimonas cestriensis TaxID=2742685 RepID=A0ABS8W7X3_9GAMM|nr:sulfotransferase [Motilimonas cestriensis]MCE2594207.1 sulfotransferase [Motilimonas cestriensis]
MDKFFIIGPPRSGTTLLQFMLRSHPNISIPTGESHFFVPLLKGYSSPKTRQDITSLLDDIRHFNIDFFDTDLHGLPADIEQVEAELNKQDYHSMAEFIDALYQLNAQGEGKSVWGEKTPYYIRHIPLLARHFPDAKFIAIVRDGRDVALSMMDRCHDFGVHNVYTAAQHWNYYLEPLRLALNSEYNDRIITLNYEDLIAQPTQILTEALNFIGQDFHPDVINNFKVKSAQPSELQTPKLAADIDNKNANKWMSKMTKRDIALFNQVCHDNLNYFNYTTQASLDAPTALYKPLYKLENYLKTLLQPSHSKIKKSHLS